MDLYVPLTPLDIGKVRSEPDFQLWACDQLALASGQVYYRQISGKFVFKALLLKSLAFTYLFIILTLLSYIIALCQFFPELWSICILLG
jgi:hypothetical protein